MSIKELLRTDKIDSAFKVTVILKGLNAALEIIGSFVILLISQNFVTRSVFFLTQEELGEDPRDRLANYLLTAAQYFSVGTRQFVFAYLLSHGVIKIILVISLLKKNLWAYPVSLIVFSLFILYQLYRYTFTHSLSLIALTIFDLVVIWLIWKEYSFLREPNGPTL